MDASPTLQFRLAKAKHDCIARMQETADWLMCAPASDHDALRLCGHRLAGTLGSFGFHEAAALARELEQACETPAGRIGQATLKLANALRILEV
jgi:HPt (histidine-containing phosphotransfer) domain-containing protein